MNRSRRHVLLSPLMFTPLMLVPFGAHAFDLVDAAQAQREQKAPHEDIEMRGAPVAGAPKIRLVSPSIKPDAPVKSPMRIELAFEASDGAAIDPASFRVLYGFLGLDITDRLREHAQLSNAGLLAEDAKLPVGEHNLTVQVADNRGRVGELQVKVAITA